MTKRVTATKSKQTRSKTEKVAIGSGNVFADLGFEDSEERLLKAKLATKIAQLIEKKGWTQAQTAERTGLDQPKVSRLLRRQLSGFSTDRLFAVLKPVGPQCRNPNFGERACPEKISHASHSHLNHAISLDSPNSSLTRAGSGRCSRRGACVGSPDDSLRPSTRDRRVRCSW
jgi:predicted XRE-type DNA-binding protein